MGAAQRQRELSSLEPAGFCPAGSTISPLEEEAGAEPHLEEGGAEPEEGAEEDTASGALRGPVSPTPQMVEDHNVSHLPFRAWCSACVRGRGKAEPRRKAVGKEEQQIPTISIDYGFFGDEGVGGSEMPVLIVFDRWSKCIWSHPVPSKGVGHPWSSTVLLRDLEKTGYRRLVLKSDQENSIKALAQSAKDGFKGEVILEHSPKGESKSNGEVGRAVQSVRGLARTLKDFVEQKASPSIPRAPSQRGSSSTAAFCLSWGHGVP